MNEPTEDHDYRQEAAEYLASVGENRKDAIKVLEQLVRASAEKTRQNAGFALAKLGSRKAIPALVEALGYDNQLIRLRAVDALGEFNGEAKPAIQSLRSAADSIFNAELRRRAVIALKKIEGEMERKN